MHFVSPSEACLFKSKHSLTDTAHSIDKKCKNPALILRNGVFRQSVHGFLTKKEAASDG